MSSDVVSSTALHTSSDLTQGLQQICEGSLQELSDVREFEDC